MPNFRSNQLIIYELCDFKSSNFRLAVFPEDILSTHWVPKEIRLDDERTLVIDPS